MLKPVHHSDGSIVHRHLAGWRRQAPDSRDFRLSLPKGFMATPPAFSLQAFCPEVKDQGPAGSCTAHGFAGIIELNEIKAGRKLALPHAATPLAALSNIQVSPSGVITFLTTVTPPAPTPTPTPTPPPTPAPTPTPVPTKLVQVGRLAHYYFTREIEGSTGEDSGATIRDTIKAGYKTGVSDESLWPYDTAKLLVKPPKAVYTAAATHKVTSYHSIADGDIATIKSTIASGYGVTFGFNVYDYFMSQAMATKGMLSVPSKSESYQGGHCVDHIAYDDNIGPFPDGTHGGTLCLNSWNRNWGLNGYFWMSYSYLQTPGLAGDNWVVMSSPV